MAYPCPGRLVFVEDVCYLNHDGRFPFRGEVVPLSRLTTRTAVLLWRQTQLRSATTLRDTRAGRGKRSTNVAWRWVALLLVTNLACWEWD